VLPTVAILGMGMLLRALEPVVATSIQERGEQLAALAGQGGMPAVLGGLRSVVASGFWLRAQRAWEQRDATGMETLIGLTVAADERPLYFG
jgi:hypothetical protein